MNIGALSETVTVSAQNAVVQTEDAKISSNMSNESIDQLPLVVGGAMRSVFDLVATVPESKGTGTTASLGGGQTGAFGATLDGISVNTNRNADTVETAFLTPSVEAITEFSVETNGAEPEFGQAGVARLRSPRNPGPTASTVRSMTSCEMTRSIEGYFEKTKGVYKQNNGGASWGPLQIPHVRRQNHAFFFPRTRVLEPGGELPDLQRSNSRDVQETSRWVDGGGRMIEICARHDEPEPKVWVHSRSFRATSFRQPYQRGGEAIHRAGETGDAERRRPLPARSAMSPTTSLRPGTSETHK
jgi:hypothetical protein